jgi:hypothetical protein
MDYSWWFVTLENTYSGEVRTLHVLGSSRSKAIVRAYDLAVATFHWDNLDCDLLAVDRDTERKLAAQV